MRSRFHLGIHLVLLCACAEVTTATPDGASRADVQPADAATPRDDAAPDQGGGFDGAAADSASPRAGSTRCRDLECDNLTQRCVLCPGAEAVCAPRSGTVPCTREGAVVAYCDGDEDCAGTQRCEWRMGDIFASMICVPTNGRACNGFCGAGCGSACRTDADCERATCGSRCVSAMAGSPPWPGFGRCQ